jgi:quinol-cytochrome oxidoreductase complex cytochrome b subunit
MLNVALVFMGVAMTDPNFAAIVTKPDNVPIVGLVFLLGFFLWLATYQAVQNDDRIARGLEPLEKLDSEKVLVWPDLVYTELICMIALTALLLVWAIGLQAPLEEPASSVKTPNPSKAPWYFLGLQSTTIPGWQASCCPAWCCSG